jgi:hypothetical protein
MNLEGGSRSRLFCVIRSVGGPPLSEWPVPRRLAKRHACRPPPPGGAWPRCSPIASQAPARMRFSRRKTSGNDAPAGEASRRGQTEKAARKPSSPAGPLGYKSGAAGGHPAPLVSVMPRRGADHSRASGGTEFPFGPAGVLAPHRAPQYPHSRHSLAASARQNHRPVSEQATISRRRPPLVPY